MHWKNAYVAILAAGAIAAVGHAQVPPDIEAGLRKIGQIVDPPCTAKLYRSLMPANDIHSNVTPLYPGAALARDVSFGPNPKDLVDIFTADKGGASRSVFIYIPGGAGNKIEQQDREANAFYDNIGRWATKNGMVGVLMQRHPGQNWDDPAKDVSAMIQWLQANIDKYKGNPDRMFIAAHSAGNGPWEPTSGVQSYGDRRAWVSRLRSSFRGSGTLRRSKCHWRAVEALTAGRQPTHWPAWGAPVV